MSIEVMSLVISRKVGSPTRKAVLLIMADAANPDGSRVFLSKPSMSRRCEISVATVGRCLKSMAEDSIIEVVGQKKISNGYVPVYNLNLDTIRDLETTAKKPDEVTPINLTGVTVIPDTPPQCDVTPPHSDTQTVLDPSLNHPSVSARDKRELVKYLYDFWNAMASVHGVPTVNTKKLNPSRGKTTLIRLAECGGDVAMLEQAISNVPKNPHWLGHNKRNWQADYDWVFKTANFDRVLEYTPPPQELQNAKSNHNKSKGQQYSESNDAALEAAIQLSQSGVRL